MSYVATFGKLQRVAKQVKSNLPSAIVDRVDCLSTGKISCKQNFLRNLRIALESESMPKNLLELQAAKMKN